MTISTSAVQQGALRIAATGAQSRASKPGRARGHSDDTPAALARSALAAQAARNNQSFGRLVSGDARGPGATTPTDSDGATP